MPFTIRLFAYSAVSCLMLAGTVSADIDFNALLAQLPSLDGEDQGLLEADQIAAEDASADSPSDQLAPLDTEPELAAEALAPPDADQPQGRTLGGPPAEVNPIPSIVPQITTPPLSEITPYSILEAEPVPGTAEASIDFQQMFEAQNRQPTDVAMGQDCYQATACDGAGAQPYCQPYRRPSLPPPATLESMYRCPPCYRDLWAGYGAERQRACEKGHQHIHNRCDCFKSKCQDDCVPACEPACDETACDQAPSFFSRLFHKHQRPACDCPYDGGSGCECGE